MADQINYDLIGDDMQAVVIALDHGEKVQAEAGALMYMTESITMNTGTGGGLLQGVKRILTGESFFITTFEHSGSGQGSVAFAAPYPGKIIPLNLSEKGTMLCQRNAFLCSAYGIDISVAFTKKLGVGFFGGEGFILQKLSGDGLAFLHACGTIIEKKLKPHETLRVDTGCLVAFQESIHYDIKFIGGIKTALLGGEGLFMANITGPGTVYLQTLPFSRLAERVVSAFSKGNMGETKRGGSLLGNLISGDR